MNPDKAIASGELLALFGVVVGEVRGGHGMPRPAAIAAVFLFYGILGIVADLGPQPGRIAAAIAGVVSLGALVGGAAGKTIIDLLNRTTALIGG